MKNTKWKDFRIGKNIFTVRARRYDDSTFGMIIEYNIFEPHSHPRNWRERLCESWKYKEYGYLNRWIEGLSEISLEKHIINTCLLIIDDKEKNEKAEKDWKNF